MELSVRRVKSFRGMEGYGFNAELWVDGKPVAFAIDEGNGGCLRLDWYDLKHGESDNRKCILTWVMTQSLVVLGIAKTENEDFYGKPLAELFTEPNARLEAYIEALVNRVEDNKRLARMRKTHVVFTDRGETYKIKLRPGEDRIIVERAIMTKHPTAQLL